MGYLEFSISQYIYKEKAEFKRISFTYYDCSKGIKQNAQKYIIRKETLECSEASFFISYYHYQKYMNNK